MGTSTYERKKLTVLNIHRYAWIRQNAEGFILEVGAQDGSIWRAPGFGPPVDLEKDIVLFDCDIWKQNVPSIFMRGDAHKLPFQDDTFDTVVLDHILEHVVGPKTTLSEAKRVTRKKVIVNVPNEFEWHPSLRPCRSRSEAIEEEVRKNGGYERVVAKQTHEHPTKFAKCTAYVDDREFQHLYHIRFFEEKTFLELMETVDLPFDAFKLYYHYGMFVDWAAIIRK